MAKQSILHYSFYFFVCFVLFHLKKIIDIILVLAHKLNCFWKKMNHAPIHYFKCQKQRFESSVLVKDLAMQISQRV